jgi:ribonuclease R
MMTLKEKLVEEVLALLSNSNEALMINEISKGVKIKSDSEEYEVLKSAISELIKNKLITKSARRRYMLKLEHVTNLIEAKITIKQERGSIHTDNPKFPNIIIKRKNFNTALNGDTVSVRLLSFKKGDRHQGEVVEVIERNHSLFAGKVDIDGNLAYLIPDDHHIYVDFLIPEKHLNGAKSGDKVTVKFLNWKDPHKSPQVEVIQILGQSGNPNTEYDSIIEEFDLPANFPDEVNDEAHSIPEKVLKSEISKRLDLRKDLIITIDPIDAKDFDDALSLKILDNGNFEVGIHIADVSHYVTENSALDIEARFRGNSVYLVDRVIPMLPEQLSNNICSLKPNVDRLAFSVIVEIGIRGAIKDYKIKKTIINSKRRYNYDEVLDILNNEEGDNLELLQKLNNLAKTLRKNRFKEGGIEFETTEVKFILDENKNPVDVKLKKATDATELVEEFMLLANKLVAQHIKVMSKANKSASLLPYLYRIHDRPESNTLSEAVKFIGNLVSKIYKKKDLSSKEINDLLHEFKGTPEEDIVSKVLIRSLPKAIYSQVNFGHFGLGFSDYTHFTSPIRRYADLVVHRLIMEYEAGNLKQDRIEYLRAFCSSVGRSTSSMEKLAQEAERASIKLTQAIMCKGLVGQEYDGIVSGVQSYGLFVLLSDIYSEGLLHIKDMNDDYYVFDEQNLSLLGKRSKKVYKLGSKIRIKIAKVNIDKRLIDFKISNKS